MISSLSQGALFTDLYQLTMAQAYFKEGIADDQACYEHYFRTYPSYGNHRAGYCVSAGTEALLDRLATFQFGREERSALTTMRSGSGGALFEDDFLDWLGEHGDFRRLSIRGVLDGQVVHPHTPITVVEGPLAVGQLLETVLLNHRNFGTLIATKAARVKQAARSGMVLEFGMRRAAGMGADLATEAALVGGADYSSNVATSHRLGLPAKGTHAHSLVQAFMALGGSELDAFRAFARVYPDDCVLLVDTVNTLESGIPNAIRVFEGLRRDGHQPVGIRLDSGDPLTLVPAAVRMLDKAGFDETVVVISDRLDEQAISHITLALAQQGEHRALRRLAYGVGTRLVTSHGAPSLGGVYKLAAIRQKSEWKPAFKMTDDPAKQSLPGRKDLWRRYQPDGTADGDMVVLMGEKPPRRGSGVWEPLLEDLWGADGKVDHGGFEAARGRRRDSLACLDDEHLDPTNPGQYPVRLSRRMRALRDGIFAASGG